MPVPLQELEGLPRGPDGYVDWTRVKPSDIRLPPDFDPDEGENEKEEEVRVDMNFDNVIFCDNLPVVPQEKYEKLVTVLTKIFGQIGQIQDGGFWMPVDEKTNMSKGFAFISYKTPQEAAAAVEQINGYKLDKNHVFKTTPLAAFDKVANVPDEYVPQEDKDTVPKEDDIHSWLTDERGRDQFAIRFAEETEIYWNDAHQSKPDEVYKRNCWTESYVQWSTRGHYLATIHRQGAALWGGPGFPRLQRFAHPGVQFLDFSPAEKYLVTCSIRDPTNARESTTITVRFFDIRCGRQVVIFQGGMEDFLLPSAASASARGGFSWPLFKWAGGCDDRFFAKIGKNAVHVYETPSMELLGKKPLRLEGVVDFQWSPAAPIFAVYQPEQGGGNQPARVSLWSVPEMQEIRQKNLFSVSEVRLFWHPQGEYLCVKVDRFTKTKKTTYTGFELFRVNEKECPMEVLELENKSEKIVAFAWEPNGHRFCIVHGDGQRPDVSFYTMRDGNSSKVKHIKTIKQKTVSGVFWSPQGKNLVFASLKNMNNNGQLEFFNADEMETLATGEHFMCTDVDWDPTGRYVATSVSGVHMENGFNMWSFNGKLLYRVPRDRFFQFIWRPRPPTLLSAEQEREIMANLKKYSKRYEELDESLTAQADTEQLARRAGLMEEWKAWLEAKRREMEKPDYKAALARLVPPKPATEEVEEVEVDVEDLIGVTEEVLHFGTGKLQ